MNETERTGRPLGIGWLMRGASLAQPSQEYIDYWRDVYRDYAGEKQRILDLLAKSGYPGAPTAAARETEVARDRAVEATAAAARQAAAAEARARAAEPSSALTPSQGAAAADYDSLSPDESARRLGRMRPWERVVFLVRYLTWKSERGELGDARAAEARSDMVDARQQINEGRPEWLRARDLARRLDAAVTAYGEAEATAMRAAPRDKMAAYTALGRALQAVNFAKAELVAAAAGLFISDEEVDAFAKWALPKTRLLLRTWLSPGVWTPPLVAPPAPVAPSRRGAMLPAPSSLPYFPGYYGAPAATAQAPAEQPAAVQPAEQEGPAPTSGGDPFGT